jgi:hypothetical protein
VIYREIRIERAAWKRVAAAVGDVYGLWRGEIGWYTDEGALMSTQSLPDEIDGVTGWTEHRLEPTVRPTDDVPPREDGIYAHRWFEVEPENLDEFLELSAGAWPDFEATYGVRIVGLWRDVDAPRNVLLLTRYPSLAVWESSRPYTPGPEAEEARKRFVRRAEITERTGVRIGRLVR